MVQHIGIVACSAEGAALCYRTICVEGARYLGAHAHPEVSMHTPSLAHYVACLECGGRFRPLAGMRVPNHVSQRGPAPTSDRSGD